MGPGPLVPLVSYGPVYIKTKMSIGFVLKLMTSEND